LKEARIMPELVHIADWFDGRFSSGGKMTVPVWQLAVTNEFTTVVPRGRHKGIREREDRRRD